MCEARPGGGSQKGWVVLLEPALPAVVRASASRPAPVAAESGRTSMPGAMALLIFVVTIRSWTQLGFTTFVPFYYVDYLKADPRLVGPLLFVFLGGGALGTVVGGPLMGWVSQHWSPRVGIGVAGVVALDRRVRALGRGRRGAWILRPARGGSCWRAPARR